MYELRYDNRFKADYKRFSRGHPKLVAEFKAMVYELASEGALSEAYRPHELSHTGGLYNGYIDAHLPDGEIDVIVMYIPHKSNLIIRFVRIGTHNEIFRGKQSRLTNRGTGIEGASAPPILFSGRAPAGRSAPQPRPSRGATRPRSPCTSGWSGQGPR